MTKLSTLVNIGSAIEKKLHAVGITSAEVLKKIGSKEAFLQLKTYYPEACLVHLYCLQGAIEACEYNQLDEATKQDLKAFVKFYFG